MIDKIRDTLLDYTTYNKTVTNIVISEEAYKKYRAEAEKYLIVQINAQVESILGLNVKVDKTLLTDFILY